MKRHLQTTLIASMALSTAISFAPAGDRQRDWPSYGGGSDQTHYSTLNQINRDNISKLQVAWTFDTGDAFPGSEMQCNPLIVDGVLYATTPKLRVIALDAATGKLVWAFDPNEGNNVKGKVRNRGLSYWTDGLSRPKIEDKRLFVACRQYLYCLDARTGKPVGSFGDQGRIDLRAGLGRDPKSQSVSMTTPGIVYKDMLI